MLAQARLDYKPGIDTQLLRSIEHHAALGWYLQLDKKGRARVPFPKPVSLPGDRSASDVADARRRDELLLQRQRRRQAELAAREGGGA